MVDINIIGVPLYYGCDRNGANLGPKILRENGFGVTVIIGQGLEGSKEILNVAINRKDLTNLKKIVYEYDKNAFITVNNINPISGGYFATNKK